MAAVGAGGAISALQFHAVRLACARHEQLLPDGSRAGFFLGDGEQQLLLQCSHTALPVKPGSGVQQWPEIQPKAAVFITYKSSSMRNACQHCGSVVLSPCCVSQSSLATLKYTSKGSVLLWSKHAALDNLHQCSMTNLMQTHREHGETASSTVLFRSWCWQGPSDCSHHLQLLLQGQDKGGPVCSCKPTSGS